jgi:ribose transport system substrate-binding protein
MRRSSRTAVVVLGALLVILAIAFAALGCGGSSTGSTTSPSASAGGGAQAANQAAAAQAYNGMTNVPTFKAPGPAFNAKTAMAGKSILSIPGSGTDPFYVQVETGMKDAAQAVGYKFTTYMNQGQLTQYQQGLQQAINQKAALVDLLAGPDPHALKPQIDQAQAAGLKVVSSHLTGFDQTVPYVNNNLPQDYGKAGQILADWIIAHEWNTHALVLVSDEIVSTGAVEDGFKAEAAKLDPGLQYKFVNVTVPDWGTKIQPIVQSAIVADPKLTYVAAIYDNMLTGAVPAVTATNSASRVHLIGFNASPGIVDMVREGKVQMDFGDMLNWAGWAIADAEMRIIAGQPVPQNGAVGQYLNNPFRMWIQSNAAEMGVPASYTKGYGDYQSQYKKLWGLK